GGRGVAFSRGVDGVPLPGSRWEPEAPPWSADVPLLICSTRTETTLIAGGADRSLFSLDGAGLRTALAGWFREEERAGGGIDAVVAAFAALHPAASPSELFFLVTSDLYSRLPGWVVAHPKAPHAPSTPR